MILKLSRSDYRSDCRSRTYRLELCSNENNFQDILTKICSLFGHEEQQNFELVFAELSGSTQQRVRYFVTERTRVGLQYMSNIVWRQCLT